MITVALRASRRPRSHDDHEETSSTKSTRVQKDNRCVRYAAGGAGAPPASCGGCDFSQIFRRVRRGVVAVVKAEGDSWERSQRDSEELSTNGMRYRMTAPGGHHDALDSRAHCRNGCSGCRSTDGAIGGGRACRSARVRKDGRIGCPLSLITCCFRLLAFQQPAGIHCDGHLPSGIGVGSSFVGSITTCLTRSRFHV
jgi:hypothetical protein